jgi:hypothetical protein
VKVEAVGHSPPHRSLRLGSPAEAAEPVVNQ